MKSYLDEFLSLRCAADVLEAVYPMKQAEKEISESMALVAAIRSKILSAPGFWNVIDVCAGNALTGILVAHLLPVDQVWAIDKRQRIREGFGKVKKFSYCVQDIYDDVFWATCPSNTILVASHPCKDLAVKILEIAKSRGWPAAILPCCISRKNLPEWSKGTEKTFGRYIAWLVYLAQKCGGKFKIDKKCLSPCRGLVTRGL